MKFIVTVFLMVAGETFALPIEQGHPTDDDFLIKKPFWLFDENWGYVIVGDLIAGNYFTIVYNMTRIVKSDHLLDVNTKKWRILAQYMLNNDGDVHTEEMYGPFEYNAMTKDIFLPFGTYHISLWFKHWTYRTCFSFDSNHNKDYHARVNEPNSTVVFEENFTTDVYGKLKGGEVFSIMYSPKRLGNEVTAQLKFSDSGSVHNSTLVLRDNGYLVAEPRVPLYAEKIIIWFYNQNIFGEKEYDDNNGENYVCEVE